MLGSSSQPLSSEGLAGKQGGASFLQFWNPFLGHRRASLYPVYLRF